MKKAVAKYIRECAAKLPLVFEMEDDEVLMTGKELKLTPIGENNPLEDDAVYAVWIPAYRAVLHEQQMKDAYKVGGAKAVIEYIKKIKEKIS